MVMQETLFYSYLSRDLWTNEENKSKKRQDRDIRWGR